MDKYLGVQIEKLQGKEFILRQPFLIQCILTALGISKGDYNPCDVPVIVPLLSKDENCPNRKHTWHYWSAIGMLGYLQNSTRPDISMAVHQCALFNACPKLCSPWLTRVFTTSLIPHEVWSATLMLTLWRGGGVWQSH